MAHWSWKTKRIGAGFLQTPTWEWYTHSKHVLPARQQMNNVTPKKYLKTSTCRAKSCHNPKWRQLEWYLPISNLKSGDQHRTPCKRLQHYRQPNPYEYSNYHKKRNVTPGNPSVKATVEKPTPKLQQCNCICRVQLDPIEGFNPRDPEVSWSPSPKKIVLWFYARPSEYWSWLAGQIAASPGPVAKPNVTRSVSWFSWRFFTKNDQKRSNKCDIQIRAVCLCLFPGSCNVVITW
jgi:hypothetical protein